MKEELRRLGSLILQCADATRVEAGGALAVDRHGFARMVTEQIRSHPHITVVPGEMCIRDRDSYRLYCKWGNFTMASLKTM